MAISERINPDNLNIHQFQEASETRRERLGFDVERDIDQETKDKIFQELKKYAEVLSFYMSRAKNIAILWPGESNLVPDNELKDYLFQDVGSSNFIVLLSYLKIIRPELKMEIPASTDNLSRKYMELDMDSERTRENYDSLLFLALANKIVYGKTYLSENDLVEINKLPFSYERAAKLKLIDPNYNPGMTPEKWKQAHRELATVSEKNAWVEYAGLASNLKILSAHKAELTENGLEFQIHGPKDLNRSTPTIPETRKF